MSAVALITTIFRNRIMETRTPSVRLVMEDVTYLLFNSLGADCITDPHFCTTCTTNTQYRIKYKFYPEEQFTGTGAVDVTGGGFYRSCQAACDLTMYTEEIISTTEKTCFYCQIELCKFQIFIVRQSLQ